VIVSWFSLELFGRIYHKVLFAHGSNRKWSLVKEGDRVDDLYTVTINMDYVWPIRFSEDEQSKHVEIDSCRVIWNELIKQHDFFRLPLTERNLQLGY